MKKDNNKKKLPIGWIIVFVVIMIFLASKHPKFASDDTVESVVYDELVVDNYVATGQNEYEDKNKCYIIAKEFVEQNLKYPKESSFNSSVVHNTDGYGKAIVLGKFTSKNGFGVKSDYSYKIWIEHNGKDWTDINNWTYSKLILEDISTGKQQVIDKRIEPKNDTSKIDLNSVDGVTCVAFERNDSFTKVKTDKKLTKVQMIKVIENNNLRTNIVMFHLPTKLNRGEEYASKIGADWFVY